MSGPPTDTRARVPAPSLPFDRSRRPHGDAPVHPTIVAVALTLIAVALLAHLIVAHNGPTWTSPLVLGDWLFSLILALAIPAYALALGRRIARPLLDPEANADHVGEALAALGLGLGTLSLATLGLGFLRLYYGPLFLALWLALTVWLRPELRRIWRQAAHRSARWLRAGMPSAPTLPQRLALLVLLLTVPSVLLRTAAPVTEWDAVIYHLASLKLYLAAHAIIPLPDLPLANNPSGAEMLLLPSLMAGAGGVGKLFNLVCALLMGLAIHNLGRRYLGASSAWIGVLLFFSPLWLQLVLPLTLTDFASSLLGLLAAADAATWAQQATHPARPPRSDPSPLPRVQHTTEPNPAAPHLDPSGSGSPPGSPSSYKSYVQAASHNAPATAVPPTDTRARVPAPSLPSGTHPGTRLQVWWCSRRRPRDRSRPVRCHDTAVSGPPTDTRARVPAPSLPFDRSRRPHGLAPGDRLLIRAGLFAGLSVSFKLTSAPSIPTLALTIGLASLMLCPGSSLARLLWAVRNGTLATVAATIPLAPWLLKNYYYFHHLFSGVAVAVSNPSHGITVDAAAPSRLDHAHWIAQSFANLLWNHLGPLSLALPLAPLLLRRPAQRVLLIYFLIGSLLWLLFVPYYEPPRYFISLVALGAALIAGSLGAALAALAALRPRPLPTTPAAERSATSPPDPPVPDTPATRPDPSGSRPCHDPSGSGRPAPSGRTAPPDRPAPSGRTAPPDRPAPSGPTAPPDRTAPSGRPHPRPTPPTSQLLPLLLGGFLVLQTLPGLFVGLRFFNDAQGREVAIGRLSRHDYLATHLPAYLALSYANDHLPATARVALVNVVSGYYLDRPHLNEWYGTTLTALQAGDASRDAVRASWCHGRYTYLILDRADGSLDNNVRKGVQPPTAFTWLRMPGIAPRLLYTARAVDLYAIQPCR